MTVLVPLWEDSHVKKGGAECMDGKRKPEVRAIKVKVKNSQVHKPDDVVQVERAIGLTIMCTTFHI